MINSDNIRSALKRLIYPERHSLLRDGSTDILNALNHSIKFKSILFFAHHKSASTLISSLLTELYANNAHVRDYSGSIDAYDKILPLSRRYITDEEFFVDYFEYLFNSLDHIYGPLRCPFFHPNLSKFNLVYIVRDPIDTIISAYYSFSSTHQVPRDSFRSQQFLSLRSSVQSAGSLENYALGMGKDWVLQLHQKLIHMHEQYGGLLVSYADVAKDPRIVLSSILSSYGCPRHLLSLTEPFLLKTLKSLHPSYRKHKRDGSSGQYSKLLSEKCINELNSSFSETNAYFQRNIHSFHDELDQRDASI
jgi:hypothetical protein